MIYVVFSSFVDWSLGRKCILHIILKYYNHRFMRKVDNGKLFWEILDYQFLTDDEIGGNA